MITHVPLPFDGGIDRSLVGSRTKAGTLYLLQNMRHSATQFGRLEQTPYWKALHTLAQGSYYDAGSQTEPSSSSVLLANNSFFMTDYCFSTGAAQIQAIYQTAVPTGETENTGCLLVVDSISGLALTLGGALDIEIDGATTFKWRKNGGAYTTLVPITTAGVSIDGGNATVYFLKATGFTIGHVWTWTRTDRSTHATVGASSWTSVNYQYYKRNLYMIARGGRVLVAKKDTAGTIYVISVGYRPVYGQALTFFYDHLIVGGYATASFDWTVSPQNRTVGWSDRTDVENFIATDPNEADVYVLPGDTQFDVIGGSNIGLFINSVAVLGEILYVFTSYGAYQTSYLGLPVVFSFVRSVDITTPSSPGRYVVRGTDGLYIITSDDIVFFNGDSIRSVGNRIVDMVTDFTVTSVTKTKFTGLFYNTSTSELVVVMFNNWGLLTYQEKYDKWYYRPISDSQGLDGRPTTVGISNAGSSAAKDTYVIGLGGRRVWIEDADFAAQPQFDETLGTAYVTPTIIFHPVCGILNVVKDLLGGYLGASLTNFSRGTVAPSATYYSTGSDVRVKLSWLSCPAGFIDPAASWATDANSYWDSSKPDGTLSFPRVAFRGLAFKLEVTGQVSGKPPGFICITDFCIKVRDPETTER